MPNWHQILEELKKAGSSQDVIRRKYIRALSEYSGRNTIIYYSGWLQKNTQGTQVDDSDKTGFMTVIHELDRTKGLDLILHTPGGNIAATESIVDYLKLMFENDIRVIVPQLAMSAGTMIACSAKEIIMGKQSSLGPIDPQYGRIPAHGLVEEFKRAHAEVKVDSSKIPIWQPIIAKYGPTLVGECEKAIEWSEQMVREWLEDNMLSEEENKLEIIDNIITELGDHSVSKSHSRHLSINKCKEIGLKIVDMEDDHNFQDLILSIHHSCIHTFSSTQAVKIIENQNDIAFIQQVQAIQVNN